MMMWVGAVGDVARSQSELVQRSARISCCNWTTRSEPVSIWSVRNDAISPPRLILLRRRSTIHPSVRPSVCFTRSHPASVISTSLKHEGRTIFYIWCHVHPALAIPKFKIYAFVLQQFQCVLQPLQSLVVQCTNQPMQNTDQPQSLAFTFLGDYLPLSFKISRSQLQPGEKVAT